MGDRRDFDCARPNEVQKIPKTAPRTSSTMRVNFNKGQEKSPRPRASKKVFFFSSTRYIFEGLQLSFFLPPQQTSPYRHRKVGCTSQEHLFFLLECQILFGSPRS